MKIAFLTTDDRVHDRNFSKPAPHFGAAPEAVLQGFSNLPGLEVHVVSCTPTPMKSPARLAENIWFHSLHVPKIGWMRTLYLGCVLAVRKKLREIQPDIVHGQGSERECAMCAISSGFPNVITIHGNMAEMARMFKARPGSFGWLAARLENYSLRRTAGVFCNSAYTEDLVRPRARRVWRVPNALRSQFFEPGPPAAPVASGRCVLLNVGYVTERKRQLEMIDLAETLHRQGLPLELHFIGRANAATAYATKFLERIKALEPLGLVRHLGTKTTEELLACFDAASGLVHFPVEEAFGLVVAEALARNLKFFGARLGGVVDITAGVSDAELFEGGDLAGLTAAVARWIRAGHRRSPAASAVMRARYHPAVVAQRHLEIYREVLGQKPASMGRE